MKKIATLIICILLINMLTVPIFSKTTKDETIYAQLESDGSLTDIQVVNHIFSDEATQYFEDITNGDNIENLTDTTQPVLGDNTISFDLIHKTKDLYYKTDCKNALPFTYEFKYFLNGEETNSDNLAGANGKILIQIGIEPNKKAPTMYQDNMMTQLSIKLDIEKAFDICAKDAAKVVTGHMTALNFAVLPGSSASYEISFDAVNFEMESWTISIIPSAFSLPENMNDMTDGFSEMSDGMGEIIDGTITLKNGLDELSQGINEANGGFKTFIKSTKTFINGVASLLDGYIQLGTKFNLLSESSNSIEIGLTELSTNANNMSSGYSQIQQGYSELAKGHSELSSLAESLLSSSDPNVVALAKGVIAENSGLDTLNANFTQINYGMSSYSEGINELSSNYSKFNNGIQEAKMGLSQLTTGAEEMKSGALNYQEGVVVIGNGMNTLDAQVSIIPENVQNLVDGQVEFQAGINEASDEITKQFDDFAGNEPVDIPSFVNQEEQIIDSIQFILKTPAIEVEDEEIIIEEDIETQGFFERLIDLFK